ncbi:MAG TPA: cysteine--tRNA ligase [Candidatus Paceibacterota bacterium]|nr:cysteine--tRNA ligase [Candidatus Paceibacterota bacterium]
MGKIELFNTLNHKKEVFEPLTAGRVKMYTCGPTVYNYAHIGNLRAYYFADTLKRVLQYNGLKVLHIMNITDIGHLTGEADDSGEDKMVKAIKREGKPMTPESLKEVAHFYFDRFKEDFLKLNLIEPEKFTFASEHIPSQIAMIEALFEKGIVYTTSDGLYFDTSKDSEYGVLGGISANEEHSRIGVNKEKRNPEDFALWKFAETADLGFPSPFGAGFPGWHIECSAMARQYLGDQFDIHTGGIDHIPVHHNNEIAQSKTVTGKVPARFWVHNNHITIGEEKMAKSGENFLSLSYMEEHGIEPEAVRMWYLQSRYSTRVDYSLEALKASHQAWKKFRDGFLSLGKNESRLHLDYKEKFTNFVNDDLDTPKALALAWELLRDEKVPNEDKRGTLLDFDEVLGFNLKDLAEEKIEIPEEIQKLLEERKAARDAKDWVKADHLRTVIRESGFEVKDMDEKQIVTRA